MAEEKRKRGFPFDVKKIGFVVAGVIFVFLVMDLNGRLNELSRLSAQKDKAATVVADLNKTLVVLNTQIAYATSEGAVEEWAYEEGHMVHAGENLIVPLQPEGATQVPLAIATPTPIPSSNWDIWMALFAGE